MAEFYGPKGSNRWHTRPTMYGSGTITTWRDGTRIYLYLDAYMSTLSGSTPSSCTSCRITASNGWASDFFELTSGYAREGHITVGDNDSNRVYYDCNDALTFYVHYYCCDGTNYWSPHCTSTDGDQSDVTMSGTVSIDSYNPYIAPTGPTYCNLNTNSLKPDQYISVSWGRRNWRNSWNKSFSNRNVSVA